MANHPLTHLLRHLRHLAGAGPEAKQTDRQLLHRFAANHDEDAFALLVRRHGAMVFGVCRRLLCNGHDAEDAFQATFVLLAQKASSTHWQESIAGWLHEAAQRVSRNARRLAARRRRQERQAAARRVEAIPSPETATLLRLWLDEELRRLPEKHRLPLILCHLEGHSHEEAARLLGWPIGTVNGRIVRALEQLRRRLKGQGKLLSVNGFAIALAEHFPALAPPETLARTTIQVAVLVARGAPVPASVSALLACTFAGKAKAALALMMLLGLLATGTAVATSRPAPEPPQPAEHVSPPTPPADRVDAHVYCCPTARTDLHGDPLPAEALARLGTIRFRHAEYITALAFTPDGKEIVSHGGDGIRIWDAATGQQLRSVLPEPGSAIYAAELTRDGKSIVSMEGRPKRPVYRVRDAGSLKILREFDAGHAALNVQVRVSPDGNFLAAINNTTNPSTLELWDLVSGQQTHSWQERKEGFGALRFSSDSKSLIAFVWGKGIRFWELPSGKKVREIAACKEAHVIALSPDGTLLAKTTTRSPFS